MRAYSILFLVLALIGPASAQPEGSPLQQDSRLSKPITVRWRKTSLDDALREVTRLTGVTVLPERSLVDEPVMAAFRDAPAREVLDQVAHLLHFTWARYGGTKDRPHYLLYQSARARREEAEMIAGARLAVERELQKSLDRMRRISRMSAEQLAGQAERFERDLESAFSSGFASAQDVGMRRLMDGMTAHSVSSPLGRAMLDFVDGLPAGVWDVVRREDPVVFSTQPGPGELSLPEGFEQRLRDSKPGFPFPKSLFRRFGPQAEQGIQMAEGMMQQRWGAASAFRVTIQMNLSLGEQPVGMLRISPAPTGGDEANALFGMSGLTLMGVPALDEESAAEQAERAKRLAADPFFGRKAVLKLPPLPERPVLPGMMVFGNTKAYKTAEVLPAVEEAFGVHLVADAYSRQTMNLFTPPGDKPIALYEVLDRLAGGARRWERDGAAIRLRSKTWAHDRRGEIPVRYLQRWEAIRARRGAFSLDDLAEIATALRDEQVETLILAAFEIESPNPLGYATVSTNRDVLRFYGRLIPGQRAALLRGQPIPVRSLFPYQVVLLSNLNRAQNRSMFAFMSGGKPARSPQQLAQAVLKMTTQGLPAVPRNGASGAASPPAPAAPVEAAQGPGAPARPAPAVSGGAPARVRGKTEAGGPGADQPVMLPGAGAFGGLVLFQVEFPDGQRDQYTIPLNIPAPAAPPSPR